MSTTGESKKKVRWGRVTLFMASMIILMFGIVWLIMICLGAVGAQTGWFVGPGFWTTWLLKIAFGLMTREHSIIQEDKNKRALTEWMIA